MTGDCVGVDIAKAGRLLQQKPAYGGNIVSVIMGRTSPQLATVRARVYEPLDARPGTGGEVEGWPVGSPPKGRAHLVDRLERHDTTGFELDAADLVVCVGPQTTARDEAAEIEELARSHGATVDGTHEICARGWIPWTREIGLYGRAVAPRLLVAVGVPGEFWDVTGWVRAKVVAGVSSSAEATLQESADVVLTADWRDALPAILSTAR